MEPSELYVYCKINNKVGNVFAAILYGDTGFKFKRISGSLFKKNKECYLHLNQDSDIEEQDILLQGNPFPDYVLNNSDYLCLVITEYNGIQSLLMSYNENPEKRDIEMEKKIMEAFFDALHFTSYSDMLPLIDKSLSKMAEENPEWDKGRKINSIPYVQK